MLKRFFISLVCVATVLTSIPFATVSVYADGEQQLYSFPFDDESAHGELFTSGDANSIQWVTGDGVGHGDNAALKTVHTDGESYTSASNVVILQLPEPLPAGGSYRIVAWTYASTDENPNKDTLTGPGFVINNDYGGEQGVVKFPPDFGTMPLDEWKAIDVTIPVQELPVSRLDFRFVINEESKHPDVWYWDNIEIYQIGDLQEVTAYDENALNDLGQPTISRNKIDTYEGFDYELWSEKREDAVSMTLTGGGTYQCEWDALNVLFRTGKKLGSTKNYKEYGDIIMEYAGEYNITKGDVNYLCMYGWTEDPMIEFYIIESHGSYKPPGGVGFKGTYQLDDGTYELYVNTRVEQPSIQGTKTFEQYFGVRTSKRTEGTISISDHFKAWEEMGLDMSGNMYEISLCVEGYRSAGNANITKHVLTVGDTVYGAPTEEPAQPDDATTETDEATTDASEATVNDEVAVATDEPEQATTPDASDVEAPKASNLTLILSVCVVMAVVVAIIIRSKVSKK